MAQSLRKEDNGPKKLKVYDPAMCCSAGVCGPNVDSALVEFAGAVKTAAEQGVLIERFNLAQQPQAFAQNPQVKQHLAELGHTKLPFIYIDDELKLTGRYPSARELFSLLKIDEKEVSEINPRTKDSKAFVVLGAGDESENADGCCPVGDCCYEGFYRTFSRFLFFTGKGGRQNVHVLYCSFGAGRGISWGRLYGP